MPTSHSSEIAPAQDGAILPRTVAAREPDLLAPSMRPVRVAGFLFFAAFLTYGIGNALVQSASGGADALSGVAGGGTLFTFGAMLMLANSAVVIGIGVLLHPVLRARSAAVAHAYLATRIVEGILLATGVIALLLLRTISAQASAAGAGDEGSFRVLGALALQANVLSYQVAMAALGLGSLFFCALLARTRLVPRALALFGLVGYAAIAAGSLLEIFGFPYGLFLSLPGALFEVSVGLWLIVKGVRA